MGYNYEEEKSHFDDDDGLKDLLKAHKNVLALSGVFLMEEIVDGIMGSSWAAMACADKLVELGIIQEVYYSTPTAGQHRKFFK